LDCEKRKYVKHGGKSNVLQTTLKSVFARCTY